MNDVASALLRGDETRPCNRDQTKRPLNIRLITVVWGAPFVDVFTRVCLRSLLAEGNIPELARDHSVTWTIYTTPADASRLRGSDVFRRAQTKAKIRLSLFEPDEIDPSDYGSHGALWARGVDLAKRKSEIVFLIIPDILYASGTLVGWAQRFGDGYRAIYTPGPQVVLETALPRLEARPSTRPDRISIGADEMGSFILEHFHPMQCALLRNAPRRMAHPEYDLRVAPGEGMVIRELTSQPFCFDPSFFAEMAGFGPCDHFDRVISVPCTTASVEPLCKRLEFYNTEYCLDETRLSNLGSWWRFFGNPGSVHYSKMVAPISIDNTTASPAFTRAAAASRFLRNQLATATALYRFMIFLQPIFGLRCSVAMLAAALYFANLRRRLIVPEGAVLLVPHDAAYDGNPSIWGLLEPGREAELASLILNHIWAPDQPRGGKPQFRTAGNMPATQWAAQVRTIAGPLMFEGYRVFIVDRILPAGRRRREPIAEPNAAAGQKPIKERAVSLSRTHAVVGIWGYPPGIRQSRIRSAYYLARHVPLLEPLVVALRGLGIRLFERAGVRRMGQASVHLLRRIRAFAFRVFRAVVRIATAPFRRLRRLWQRVGKERQAAPSRPVSREHEAQLQEIRLAIAIVGLQKTLAHFRQELQLANLPSAPLQFVHGLLERNGLAADPGETCARALTDLAKENPGWMECWTELATIRAAQKRTDEAILCCEAATRGASSSENPQTRQSHRAQAFAAHARLLRSKGLAREAASSYKACLDLSTELRIARIEYAALHRQLGEYRQSAMTLLGGVDNEQTLTDKIVGTRDARRLVLKSLKRYGDRASETPGKFDHSL